MTRLLGKIRQAKRQSLKRQIAVTAGIIVLGLAVGVLQKRIDVLPGNAFPLWLQRLQQHKKNAARFEFRAVRRKFCLFFFRKKICHAVQADSER